MTEHFDCTRWDAYQDAMEAMDVADAFCRGCGICVSVVNEHVRIKDAQVYLDGLGGWFVLCSACEQKVTSR